VLGHEGGLFMLHILTRPSDDVRSHVALYLHRLLRMLASTETEKQKTFLGFVDGITPERESISLTLGLVVQHRCSS
jgi:hypothetical protein